MSDIRSSMSSIPADRWDLAFGKKPIGQIALEQMIKHISIELDKVATSVETDAQEC